MPRMPLRPALRAYAHAPAGVAAFVNAKAANHDGTDDGWDASMSTVQRDLILTADGYSMSFWLKCSDDGLGLTNYRNVIDIGNTSAYQPTVSVGVYGTSAGLRFYFLENLGAGGASTIGQYNVLTASISGTLDWHHVCVTSTTGVYGTSNGSPHVGVLKIYVDGVDRSTTPSEANKFPRAVARMGLMSEGAAFVPGILDEVSVFNRALTSGQVVDDIYSGGAPTDLLAGPLSSYVVHWYRMGDDAGDSYGASGELVDQVTSGGINLAAVGVPFESTDVPS